MNVVDSNDTEKLITSDKKVLKQLIKCLTQHFKKYYFT